MLWVFGQACDAQFALSWLLSSRKHKILTEHPARRRNLSFHSLATNSYSNSILGQAVLGAAVSSLLSQVELSVTALLHLISS